MKLLLWPSVIFIISSAGYNSLAQGSEDSWGSDEDDAELSPVKTTVFKSAPNVATIYFATPGSYQQDQYINLSINDHHVRKFEANEFIHVKATPGHHRFLVNYYLPITYKTKFDLSKYDYMRSTDKNFPGHTKTLGKFDLELKAGSLVMITCGYHDSGTWRDGDRYLFPSQECSNGGKGTLTSYDGVTSCAKVHRAPKEWLADSRFSLSGYKSDPVANELAETYNCRLTTYQDQFMSDSPKLVKADVALIENDGADEFEKAQREHSVKAYKRFIKKYPSSKHLALAKKMSHDLELSDYQQAQNLHTSLAYEQFLAKYPGGQYSNNIRNSIPSLKRDEQIDAVIQRYTRLPLQVRKDKIMLLLTNHLKKKKFKESLLYFEVLDRMKVKLSASFSYFWGEALVETGQNKKGLDKLYAYISLTGSKGKYYSQALNLTNVAEGQ